MARRSLLKNRVFSFINIFGLGVGIAAFLFIIHYVRFEKSYEEYNPNADRVFRVTLDIYNGTEYVMTDCETHPGFGPLVKERIPEVVDFARMFHNDGLQEIRVGDDKFLDEGIYFADPSAFEVFGIKTLKGDSRNALVEPFQAVLSTSVVKKYFGNIDPLGKSIEIDRKLYQITAVMADCPANTHLKFGILLSHSTMYKINEWYRDDNWGGNNEFTYFLMVPGASVNDFNKKLLIIADELKEKIDYSRYTAEPIKDIHLYSNKSFEPEPNGSIKIVYFMITIALFIVVIAWVNYVNLSTAKAIERGKEVGIRKVMGSVKHQLVFQFLSESFIVNLIAGILALFLFWIALPMFRDITGQSLPLNFVNDINFWLLLTGLIFFGSVLAGLYPAFVLSSFQPATILKGKFQSSARGQQLRKALVVFQFGATIVLMVCLIAVYAQINFLRDIDLGMNIDQTLAIRAPRTNAADSVYKVSFQNFKTELLQNSSVKKVGRSDALPGLSVHELSTTTFRKFGEEKSKGNYEYYYFSADADFIPALGMSLVEGKNFEDGLPNTDQVIINEEAARQLGYTSAEEAIGGRITFRTRNVEYSTIVGVLKNFYQRSPKEKQMPILLYYRERSDYFSIRLNTQNVEESIATIKELWTKNYPDVLFHYFFIDEVYNSQYQSDAQFGKIVAIFSALAIFIACLGLFGLSSYTIVQRAKEIGIRKVLGASVHQIVQLLSADFMKVILVASIVAIPIAYFIIHEWLMTYSVRVTLNVWMFGIPMIVILMIAFLTVSFQTIKTAIANPVKSLKQD